MRNLTVSLSGSIEKVVGSMASLVPARLCWAASNAAWMLPVSRHLSPAMSAADAPWSATAKRVAPMATPS